MCPARNDAAPGEAGPLTTQRVSPLARHPAFTMAMPRGNSRSMRLLPLPIVALALALAGCASMCGSKNDSASEGVTTVAPVPTSTEEPAYMRRLHVSKPASALPAASGAATMNATARPHASATSAPSTPQ